MPSVDCATCGGAICLGDAQLRRLRRTGDQFYCPQGHPNVFNQGTTEEDKLRHQLQHVRQERDRFAKHLDAKKKETRRLARHLANLIPATVPGGQRLWLLGSQRQPHPLDYPCPYCLAPPGDDCRNSSGTLYSNGYTHADRGGSELQRDLDLWEILHHGGLW